jgi:anthranilate phosphoribosyltransferase
MDLDPSVYGFAPCTQEELVVHDKDEAVAVMKEILAGRGSQAMRDMVALNAAFAIYMLEDGKSLEECVALARKGVNEGAGSRVLA